MDNYTTGRRRALPALDHDEMLKVLFTVMKQAQDGDADARNWLLEYEKLRTRSHKTAYEKVASDRAEIEQALQGYYANAQLGAEEEVDMILNVVNQLSKKEDEQ